MTDSHSEPDRSLLSRIRMLLWLCGLSLIGYPLSIGPALMTLLLAERCNLPGVDFGLQFLTIVYAPLEDVTERSDILLQFMEAYVSIWDRLGHWLVP